jgi:peptide/nickel transport system ATP-binding protein
VNSDGRYTVLAVDGLTVGTGRGRNQHLLLDSVDLHLAESEIVGVVGESGSGKSTLCRAIARLLPQNLVVRSGSATLRGTDLLRSSQSSVHRMRPGGISMVFQSPFNALNPVLPVGVQVVEAFRPRGHTAKIKAVDRSVQLLERMGINDAGRRLHDYPHQFSGGQRQRIVIAIALATEPAVLLADEPTSALDVTTQAGILQMFSEIARERGTSILLVSHNYAVVSQSCARVIVLYAGRVLESGPTDELLFTPRHPYTAALIGSLPSMDQKTERLEAIPGSPPSLGEFPVGCAFRPRCTHAEDRCATGAVQLRPLDRAHATACIRVREIWPETRTDNRGPERPSVRVMSDQEAPWSGEDG